MGAQGGKGRRRRWAGGRACIAFIASSNPVSGIRSMATAGTRAALVRHESVLGRVAHWKADAPRARSSSMATCMAGETRRECWVMTCGMGALPADNLFLRHERIDR